MNQVLYASDFRSCVEEMSRTLDEAVDAMVRYGWVDGDLRFRARLCLEEALTNAIRHGNRGNETLRVRLEIEQDGDLCRIRVSDQGNGFCPENVPGPKPDQLGGRGVCIMRRYMEDVSYDHANRRLEMTIRRKSPCEERMKP